MRPREKLLSMPLYYSGPRQGIAMFGGVPHLFDSEWRDDDTDADGELLEDVYALYRLDPHTLAVALADWARWAEYSELGTVSIPPHLAGLTRAELEALATKRVNAITAGPVHAYATADFFDLRMAWHPDDPDPPTVRWRLISSNGSP